MAYVLVLGFMPDQRFVGSIVCILGTFAIRAAAIQWNLRMPGFAHVASDEK